MKIFKKTSLPEEIIYNGKRYVVNMDITKSMLISKSSISRVSEAAKSAGRNVVLVEVLSNNLKGKLDLHRKPYEPTRWIYSAD